MRQQASDLNENMSFFKTNVTANVVKPVRNYNANETNKSVNSVKLNAPKPMVKSPLNSKPEGSKAAVDNDDEWSDF